MFVQERYIIILCTPEQVNDCMPCPRKVPCHHFVLDSADPYHKILW